VKPGLSGLGNGAKLCETPPEIEEVELFLGIATTEIKGWVTKIQFQRGRLTREQMLYPPFQPIALWV
jgi:hypothetical protein